MPLRDRRFLEQERKRLTRYQHQHRGLSFIKLLLPPTSDKNVNIIGRDGHVYRGKIPRVPLDQLPSDVDPKTVEEEELYKEIRDMKFLSLPLQEPPGPTRRIGGEYTKEKRLVLAPATSQDRKVMDEAPIIGTDGKIYRISTSKSVSVSKLDRKLRESKTSIHSNRSDRDSVVPANVILHIDGRAINPVQERPIIGADGKVYRGPISKYRQVSESDRKHDTDFVDPEAVDLELDGEILAAKKHSICTPASTDVEKINEMRFEDLDPKKDTLSSDVSTDTPQAVTDDMPKADTEDVPRTVTEDMSKADTEATSHAVTEDMPKADTEATPQAVTKDMPKAGTEDIPQAVTEDMPKADTEDMPKADTEDMPKADTEGSSKADTDDIPE